MPQRIRPCSAPTKQEAHRRIQTRTDTDTHICRHTVAYTITHSHTEQYGCAGIWCLLTWFRLVCLVYFMTITEPPTQQPAPSPSRPLPPATHPLSKTSGLTCDQSSRRAPNYNTQLCLVPQYDMQPGEGNRAAPAAAAGTVNVRSVCVSVSELLFVCLCVCATSVCVCMCEFSSFCRLFDSVEVCFVPGLIRVRLFSPVCVCVRLPRI